MPRPKKRRNYKFKLIVEDLGGDRINCKMTFSPAVPGDLKPDTPALHTAMSIIKLIGEQTSGR